MIAARYWLSTELHGYESIHPNFKKTGAVPFSRKSQYFLFLGTILPSLATFNSKGAMEKGRPGFPVKCETTGYVFLFCCVC